MVGSKVEVEVLTSATAVDLTVEGSLPRVDAQLDVETTAQRQRRQHWPSSAGDAHSRRLMADEQATAASKIQAIQKGKSARKIRQQQVEAATKVQAVSRGRSQRLKLTRGRRMSHVVVEVSKAGRISRASSGMVTGAPLARWRCEGSLARTQLGNLDWQQGPAAVWFTSLPPLQAVFAKWICLLLTASVLGVVCSISFVLVGKFPPLGYCRKGRQNFCDGERCDPDPRCDGVVVFGPVVDGVLCAVGYMLQHWFTAPFLVLLDVTLETRRYVIYYCVWNCMFTLGVRLLVEVTTDWPCTLYVGLLLGLYPYLDNPWHVLSRLTGEQHWGNPLKWSKRRSLEMLVELKWEVAAVISIVAGTVWALAYTIADKLVWHRLGLSDTALALLRPLAGYAVRRSSYGLWCCAMRCTASPFLKVLGFLPLFVSLAQVYVRTLTAAPDAPALAVNLALQWLFFLWGSINFYLSTSPQRPTFGRHLQRYLYAMTFEKAKALPEARTADYRAYEVAVERMQFVTAIITLMLGAVWQMLVFGLPASHPVRAFWFPNSHSVRYLAIGLANESVLALAALAVLERAAARHKPVCHLTDIFPGMLLEPWTPIKVVMVTSFCYAFLSQLAYALDEDFPDLR